MRFQIFKISCVFSLLLSHFGASYAAPNFDTIYTSTLRPSANVMKNCGWASVPSDLYDRKKIHQNNFIPLVEYKNSLLSTNSRYQNKSVVSFTIYNNTSNESFFYYNGVFCKSLKVFELDSTTNETIPVESTRKFDGFVLLNIPKNATKVFFIEISFGKLEFLECNAHVMPAYSQRQFKSYQIIQENSVITFGLLTCGFLALMTVFCAISFFISKRKEFLYYGINAAIVTFLIFSSTYYIKRISSFGAFYQEYLILVFLLFGSIAYGFFLRTLFETQIRFRRLDQILMFMIYFIIASLAICTFFYFFSDNVSVYLALSNIVKMSVVLLLAVYSLIAVKEKNTFLNIVNLAHLAMLLCFAVALCLNVFQINGPNSRSHVITAYQLGQLCSAIGFLFALAEKYRMELILSIEEKESQKRQEEKSRYEKEVAILTAQITERQRISQDLHDDLGAGMTSIRMYTELAKNKLGKEVPELHKISEKANEVLEKMNAIIWSMNHGNDSLPNLAGYMRSFFTDFFEDSLILASSEFPEHIPEIEINGQSRRNVFLIFKEALNNIMKHSGATKVLLSLKVEEDLLKIVIQDNGKGIEIAAETRFGNGISNMHKRATDGQMSLKIENVNGTKITLVKLL